MKQNKCIQIRIIPPNGFICIYFMLHHIVVVFFFVFAISVEVFPYRGEKTDKQGHQKLLLT